LKKLFQKTFNIKRVAQMYMLLMIAISLTKGKSPPPFTFNIDQSIPSKELTFPFLSSYDHAPLSVNESVQLKKIFDGIPSFLAEQKSKMNAPGVSLTVTQNGEITAKVLAVHQQSLKRLLLTRLNIG